MTFEEIAAPVHLRFAEKPQNVAVWGFCATRLSHAGGRPRGRQEFAETRWYRWQRNNSLLADESSCVINRVHLGISDAEQAAASGAQLGTGSSMGTSSVTGLTRRGLLAAFATTAVAAAPSYANAFSFLRGSGDVRRIRMYSGRTGEAIDTIYWIEGQYIPEALNEISYFMRDWRQDEIKPIDPRTIDIATAAHRLLDVDEPFMLLSGYRTKATNALLRESTPGVARKSMHIEGKAADLRLRSRSVSQIYAAAMTCSAGGVGKYSHSDFVHMDCGPVRTWGG